MTKHNTAKMDVFIDLMWWIDYIVSINPHAVNPISVWYNKHLKAKPIPIVNRSPQPQEVPSQPIESIEPGEEDS